MSVPKVSADFVILKPPAQQKAPYYNEMQINAIRDASIKFLTPVKLQNKSANPSFEVKDVKVLPSFTRLVETLRSCFYNRNKSLHKEMEGIQKALKDIRPGVFLNPNFAHISNCLLAVISKEISKVKDNSHLIDIQRLIEIAWETRWLDEESLQHCVKSISQKYQESRCMGEFDLLASSLTFIKKIEAALKNKQDIAPFKTLVETKALEKIDHLPLKIDDSNIDMIRECLLGALRAPPILMNRKLPAAIVNFAIRIDQDKGKHLRYAGEIVLKAIKEYHVKFESMDFPDFIFLGLSLLRLSAKESEEGHTLDSYRTLGKVLLNVLRPHTPMIKTVMLFELFNCFNYKEPPEEKKKIFSLFCQHLKDNRDLQEKSLTILTDLQTQNFDKKWLHELFTVVFDIEKTDRDYLLKNRKRISPLDPEIYFEFLTRMLVDHKECGVFDLHEELCCELNPMTSDWVKKTKYLLELVNQKTQILGKKNTEMAIKLIEDVFSMVFHDEARNGILSAYYASEFTPLILTTIKTLESIQMQELADHFKKQAKSTQLLLSFEAEVTKIRTSLEFLSYDYIKEDIEKTLNQVLLKLEFMLNSGPLKVDFKDRDSLKQFTSLIHEIHHMMNFCLFYQPSALVEKYLTFLEKVLRMASEKDPSQIVLNFLGQILRATVDFPDTLKTTYLKIAPIIKKQGLTIEESSKQYLEMIWKKEDSATIQKQITESNQKGCEFRKLINVIGLIADDKILTEKPSKTKYERFFAFFTSFLKIIFNSKAHVKELEQISNANPSDVKYQPEKYPILSTLYYVQYVIDNSYTAQKNIFLEQRNKLIAGTDPKMLIALARLTHNTARSTK